MAQTQEFDIAVIGSGPGGYPAAIRAASRGKNVALIEAKEIGGTCLNRGCIPSKALIASAAAWNQLKHAAVLGIKIEGSSFDYGAMCAHKDQVVAKLRKSLENLIAANGVVVIRGRARFISPKELVIEGEKELRVTAKKIIIASGSEPRPIGAFPFDRDKIIDSTTMLEVKTLPKTLAIIGGGVIGCEFASLYSLLGVKVFLFEMLPALLPMEDASISKAISKAFEKRGVTIETGAEVEKIEKSNGFVKVHLASKKTYSADLALVAVGRKMNLEGLGIETLGIKMTTPSQIAVDEHMETSVPGIYAVGDITSKWWLAHVATHQGLVAADHASGYLAKMHYDAIPNVIFTYPEIATVGISLEEAKKRGHQVTLGNFPLQGLGKAQASNELEGFAEILVDKSTGQILGARVVGHEASSLIGEMALAIQNELTIECIHDTIHAHPTFAEAWMESALLASDLPLHFLPKARR